jgi:hypothetical protein
MKNCIKFIDPRNPSQLLPDIPCESYEFPNFNNNKFDATKFDQSILKWYGNENPIFKNNSQYQYPEPDKKNSYINRKLPKRKHLQEHQKFVSKYINMHNNFTNGALIFHQLGSGKCHEKGTPILMYDGSIKKVENIKVDEQIMGDDSTPRKVLELVRGKDIMYKVVPIKGEPFVCNSEHMLSLKCSNFGVHYANDKRYKKQTKFYVAKWFDNETIKMKSKWFETRDEAEKFLKATPEEAKYCDVSIKDYLKLSNNVKSQLKLYRTGVEFKEKKVPFSPYMIGVWLGDGTGRTVEITNQDAKVINGIRILLKNNYKTLYLSFNQASKYTYRVCSTTKTNKFMDVLRNLKLLNNKHIPDVYKINSRKVRLELLAGIIDTDGHLDKNGGYEITQKNEKIIDDLLYLCRSLGFSAYKAIKKTSWKHKGVKNKGTAFRLHVYGDGIEKIPVKIERKKAEPRQQKKNVLVTGFKLIKKPVDNYYGFTINKNHRYLLGDFTVTHNSCSAIAVGEAYKQFMKPYGSRKVFIITPRALIEQFKTEIIGKLTSDGIVDSCSSDIRVVNDENNYIRVTVGNDIAKQLKLSDKYINVKNLTPEQTTDYLNKNKLEKIKFSKHEERVDAVLKNMEWIFYTHDTFIRRIDDIEVGKSNNENHKEQAEEIKEAFENGNQLFIFDEIQNLITDPDREVGEQGKRYRTLSNVLKVYNNKNNRYVFLTATPIRNKPYELGLLLNLLNPRLYFPETIDEFKQIFIEQNKNNDDKIEYRFINRPLFRWMCKGYVSYFRGGNPELFPRKRVTYMYHGMCMDQNRSYIEEKQKQDRLKDKELEALIEQDSQNFNIKLREFSYCSLKTKNEIDNGMKVYGPIEYFKENISPKLAKVAEMVHNSKEKSFIYSEFINYGIAPLIMLFEKLGYEIVYGSKSASNYSRAPDKEKYPSGRILIWTGSKGTTKKGVEGIYPELAEKPNDKELPKIVSSVFNRTDNKNGKYIKAIKGSSAIKEGVSFRFVNNVHLLSPWWNNARTDQIIARAIRFGSHDSGATVNVYRHITTLKGSPFSQGYNLNDMSVEQYMDIVSTRKSNLNREFELTLKESSVDCVLNKYGNLIRLTEINDKMTINGKETDMTYYIDESTGDTYCESINKSKNLENIVIKSTPTRFGNTTITRTNKLFKPISKHPLVSYENLICNSETAFKYELRTEKYIKKLLEENEKNKMAPKIFKLLDNKKFENCLIKVINSNLKTEFKKFKEEDKERKKRIQTLIALYLKVDGIEPKSELGITRKEHYENYLYDYSTKKIESLISQYKTMY